MREGSLQQDTSWADTDAVGQGLEGLVSGSLGSRTESYQVSPEDRLLSDWRLQPGGEYRLHPEDRLLSDWRLQPGGEYQLSPEDRLIPDRKLQPGGEYRISPEDRLISDWRLQPGGEYQLSPEDRLLSAWRLQLQQGGCASLQSPGDTRRTSSSYAHPSLCYKLTGHARECGGGGGGGGGDVYGVFS